MSKTSGSGELSDIREVRDREVRDRSDREVRDRLDVGT
jgi:hypothetical protein